MSERSQFWRFFLGNFVRFVLLPLLIIGLIIGGIWLFFIRDDKPQSNTTNQTSQSKPSEADKNQDKDSGSTGSSEEPSGQGGSGATTGGQSTQPGQGQANANTAPQAGDVQQLAESGPGDVVAVVLATTVVGAAGHYVYRINRLSKQH